MKEAHETLYHFHEPDTEAEANAWLFNDLLRYNDSSHRSESHSPNGGLGAASPARRPAGDVQLGRVLHLSLGSRKPVRWPLTPG